MLYLDVMAICQTHGSPNYFIAITCNPQWHEITSALLPTQILADRPDMESIVFQIKLYRIIDNIVDKHVLERVLAYTYTIEFPNQGIPQAHMLIILALEIAPSSTTSINSKSLTRTNIICFNGRSKPSRFKDRADTGT